MFQSNASDTTSHQLTGGGSCAQGVRTAHVQGSDEACSASFPIDAYHLVWVFTACCVMGLIGETVVSYFIDGRWENRAGFLWGPFSPIYGVGGVLMTVALAHLADERPAVLFGTAAVIGAAFEWFAGWFWENAFGIVAWDYSDQPFNVGGHTCLGIALVWGAAGLAWVRLALPVLLRASESVPVAWRATITWGLLAFFLIDAAMTFVAFDCWMNRLAGAEPAGPIQEYFAERYGDEFMRERFQTMSLYPSIADFRR